MAEPPLIEAPPSRYRVVEQDRRLVVIDADSENPPVDRRTALGLPDTPVATRLSGPVQTRFDGGGTLTTHPLYDQKGPRTITLDPVSMAWIGRFRLAAVVAIFVAVLIVIWQPAALVLLALLFQPKLWKSAKAQTTAWLDRHASD